MYPGRYLLPVMDEVFVYGYPKNFKLGKVIFISPVDLSFSPSGLPCPLE